MTVFEASAHASLRRYNCRMFLEVQLMSGNSAQELSQYAKLLAETALANVRSETERIVAETVVLAWQDGFNTGVKIGETAKDGEPKHSSSRVS